MEISLPSTGFIILIAIATTGILSHYTGAVEMTISATSRTVSPLPSEFDVDSSLTYNIEDTSDDVCVNFSGRGDREKLHRIQSPAYPNAYPAGIQCIRVIRAPKGGYSVLLDFRGEFFEIEETYEAGVDVWRSGRVGDKKTKKTDRDRCANDFLEIRDGKYGFSPLIERFCGLAFPRRVIQAYSGYMWIRFRSDALLEYRGFSAEYRFAALPPGKAHLAASDCLVGKNPASSAVDDGIVDSALMLDFFQRHRNASNDIECVWQLEASKPEFQLRVFMEHFRLGVPNSCGENFVEVYGATTADAPLRQYCGATASNIATAHSRVFVRIFATRRALLDADPPLRIRALYTSYTRSKNCSEQGLFPCGDETCIPQSLLCNGRANCLYKKDEEDCPSANKFKPIALLRGPYFVILMIVCALIGAIMMCAIVLNYCPRFRRQQKKYDQFLKTMAQQTAEGAAKDDTAGGDQRRHTVAVLYPQNQPLRSHNNIQLYLPETASDAVLRQRSDSGSIMLVEQDEEDSWRRPTSPLRDTFDFQHQHYQQPDIPSNDRRIKINIHPYPGAAESPSQRPHATAAGILRSGRSSQDNRVSSSPLSRTKQTAEGYEITTTRVVPLMPPLHARANHRNGGTTNVQRTPDVILNGLIASGNGGEPGRASSVSTTSHYSPASAPSDRVRLAGGVRTVLTTFGGDGGRGSSQDSGESSSGGGRPLSNYLPPPAYCQRQQRRTSPRPTDADGERTSSAADSAKHRPRPSLSELGHAYAGQIEEEQLELQLLGRRRDDDDETARHRRQQQTLVGTSDETSTDTASTSDQHGVGRKPAAASRPSVTFEDEIHGGGVRLKDYTRSIRI